MAGRLRPWTLIDQGTTQINPGPLQVTTEAMAFMVEHTSGVICMGMEGATLDRLRLPLMVSSLENEEAMYTVRWELFHIPFAPAQRTFVQHICCC